MTCLFILISIHGLLRPEREGRRLKQRHRFSSTSMCNKNVSPTRTTAKISFFQ